MEQRKRLPVGQSARWSAVEALVVTAGGLLVGWFGNVYLAKWLFGVRMSSQQGLRVTIMFCIIGFVNKYMIRRLFNRIATRVSAR